jgi:hypothetical protein
VRPFTKESVTTSKLIATAMISVVLIIIVIVFYHYFFFTIIIMVLDWDVSKNMKEGNVQSGAPCTGSDLCTGPWSEAS